jgi:hypothetical protein
MTRFLAALSLAAALASAASATIIFFPGNDPAWVDENILFRGRDSAPMIQGVTNNTDELIDFFGAGIDLYGSQAEGQAMLQGADNQSFTALTIKRDNPIIGFSGIIVDIRLAHPERDGTVTFTTTDMGNATTRSDALRLTNGENYFTIYSDDPNALLTQLSFTTDGDVADVRHVRIGGIRPVPEPASIACLAVGATVLLRRRKRR